MASRLRSPTLEQIGEHRCRRTWRTYQKYELTGSPGHAVAEERVHRLDLPGEAHLRVEAGHPGGRRQLERGHGRPTRGQTSVQFVPGANPDQR